MNVLLILGLCILLLFFVIWSFESTIVIDRFVDYTNEETIQKIRDMLKDINNLFNKKGIEYMIDGGTLLGAVRHNDVIPWDDDGDIVILNDDGNAERKLLSLTIDLRNMGYGITKFWGGYRIYNFNGDDINIENKNWTWNNKDIEKNDNKFAPIHKYPFIDIFFMERDDMIYRYSCKNVRSTWPNFYHSVPDVFPLKEYKFNNFFLIGPNNPDPYLTRSYGSDWKTIAYRSYDHKNQKIIPQNKFTLI